MPITRIEKRAYQDRKEYIKLAVTKRRRILKVRAVTLMGGKCMLCGYDKHPGILDFHHVDASTKLFGVSSGGFSRSWQNIYEEIQKCILVCANCHREVELQMHEKTKIQEIFKTKWTQIVMDNSLAHHDRGSYNRN